MINLSRLYNPFKAGINARSREALILSKILTIREKRRKVWLGLEEVISGAEPPRWLRH